MRWGKKAKNKTCAHDFLAENSVIIISQVDRIVLCSCQTQLIMGKRYKCICSFSCNFIRYLYCCLCPCSGLHLIFSLAEVSYDQNLFTNTRTCTQTHTHDAHRVCDVLSQAIHTILQALSIIRVLWMMRVFTKTYDMPHVATYNDVWSRHTHRRVKYLADTFVCRRWLLG